MGIATSCFRASTENVANPPSAVPALWRGDLAWAPPAGLIDYTPFLHRIDGPLRPDNKRTAAGAGSDADEIISKAIHALGLTAHGARLNIAGLADILCEAGNSAKQNAVITLSRLGLLNLAVSIDNLPRLPSMFCRQLNLPLSATRPTLAHVLAHAGRVMPDTVEAADSVNLRTRFEALQAAGVNLDTPSLHGRTPLHLAVLSKNSAAVDALLSLGVDINATDRGNYSALMLASRNRFEYAVTALVAAGARLETADRAHHNTALHLAATSGTAAIIEALTRAGAPTHARESHLEAEALHLAAGTGHADTARALLEAGVPPDRTAGRDDDMTALMYAAVSGHANTILTLAHEGAELNLRTGQQQQTALHLAARADQPYAIEALVAAGADVNAQDAQGITPLHLAAWLGKVRATRELIKRGAEINRPDHYGRRPVDLAGEAGRSFTFEALVKAGAQGPYEFRDRWAAGGGG